MSDNCPICGDDLVTGSNDLAVCNDYPALVFHAHCVENVGVHIASTIATSISNDESKVTDATISNTTIEALTQANVTLQIVAASILDKVTESILSGEAPYKPHVSMLLDIAKVGSFLDQLVKSSKGN